MQGIDLRPNVTRLNVAGRRHMIVGVTSVPSDSRTNNYSLNRARLNENVTVSVRTVAESQECTMEIVERKCLMNW